MASHARSKTKPAAASASGPAPDRLLVAIAALGMVVTAILLWHGSRGDALPYCGPGSGCDIVQGSRWARFLGLPLALWGFLAYLALALAALGPVSARRRWSAVVATVGCAVSAYLTLISFAVLEAVCAYCLVSAALMTAAFAASWHAAGAFVRAGHGLGLAVAAILALLMHVNATAGFGENARPDPYLAALAQHLTRTGTRFYGAEWCPHCQEQKAAFGAAAAALPYIECAPNGPRAPRATACEMAGIRNYPTWIIDGRRIERVLPPARLASLTGFRPEPGPVATR